MILLNAPDTQAYRGETPKVTPQARSRDAAAPVVPHLHVGLAPINQQLTNPVLHRCREPLCMGTISQLAPTSNTPYTSLRHGKILTYNY